MNRVLKTVSLFLAVLGTVCLCAPQRVDAQSGAVKTPTPPTVVPSSGNLGGVPANIKTLILSFAVTRDKFLAQQNQLLTQLGKSVTPQERNQVRDQLQQNRQAFLTALQGFRMQLKTELTALKGKISHEEFLRIIDAAHNAAVEGGLGHHRGH